jgi:Zn-dependent M16 (insulinase) family peptidase
MFVLILATRKQALILFFIAITTAGSDGFLQLLPVYVDHILFPTLTNEGFYTEVHHIDQNGEDAGNVYNITQYNIFFD